MVENLELYIHYPFCVKKCAYCDFLSASAPDNLRSRYLQALKQEILSVSGSPAGERTVRTIYIGGGTPSLMRPDELYELMRLVRSRFILSPDCEMTMEANPGTLHRPLLEAAAAGGINRLSIGLQSADDGELQRLGRIHRYRDFCESYALARQAGFQNINVDLMSALPGQTLLSWEKTLSRVIALAPEHISAYSLMIEEGTPFYEIYGDGAAPDAAFARLPDEDTERRMYVRTRKLLERSGYHRYEISNYAKEGYVCRHNIGYWTRRDYLGLGLGASSLLDNVRFENTRDLQTYLFCFKDNAAPEGISSARVNTHVLTRQEQMEEFMFLGLRLTEGIRDRDFQACFGEDMLEVYGETIRRHCRNGLLIYIEETGQLRLTDRGIDLSNYVFSDFLLS